MTTQRAAQQVAPVSGCENLTFCSFAPPERADDVAPAGPVVIGEMPRLLAGRYRIERLLGAGGMGMVYLARDLLSEQFGATDSFLALKVLRDEFAQAADASALLYCEFALTRHLRHDHVLQVYGFEVDSECRRAFITMELMRGLTLDRLLCERPLGLPWAELRGIALAMLDALAHAHARGVLHGDLKPSNVMLSEEGVRLFDFGLGRPGEGVLSGLACLSRERFKAWTPGYAAPELLAGQPLTASADVYAAACVIYELAGGKPVASRGERRPERKLTIPRHLPGHCWPALRKALSADPRRRTLSAARLREVLGSPSSLLRRLLDRA